jgi:ATP-binding protein involved in chromosome partitioning
VNLAAALSARGHAVGLLDADIYGPSIPHMLGITDQPATVEGKIEPVQRFGIDAISMGMFIEPDKALIWRGPMVMKAIQQLLEDVRWGEKDFLVVDLPPGTGDAQLTLVQSVPLTGAVVVTTPQEVALMDARKAVNMFRATECPVLGIVENMSHFACPHCGKESEIFPRGGGKSEAERLGVPFLAEVPIDPSVRESGDAGRPAVDVNPDAPVSRAFLEMADELIRATSKVRGES